MRHLGYKQAIKRNFSNAARSYDENSGLQREVGGALLRHLPQPLPSHGTYQRVLDIGCGTGTLTALMEGLYSRTSLFGMDIAPPMLLKAREKLKNAGARLAGGDFDELPFSGSAFDLAASNLTYQWARDLLAAFKEVQRVLIPGGAFVFSTFGPGTLTELRQSLDMARELRVARDNGGKGAFKPVVFPGSEEVSAALGRAGFVDIEVSSETIVKSYPDMLSLLKRLKLIGARNPNPPGFTGLGKAGVIKAAAEIYGERFGLPGHGVGATYEVLYVSTHTG